MITSCFIDAAASITALADSKSHTLNAKCLFVKSILLSYPFIDKFITLPQLNNQHKAFNYPTMSLMHSCSCNEPCSTNYHYFDLHLLVMRSTNRILAFPSNNSPISDLKSLMRLLYSAPSKFMIIFSISSLFVDI